MMDFVSLLIGFVAGVVAFLVFHFLNRGKAEKLLKESGEELSRLRNEVIEAKAELQAKLKK